MLGQRNVAILFVAAVALALGEGETVHKVSVIPRGIGALGYTLRRPTEDRYLMSKSELEVKMAIALGGRASEAVFFDEISTGAADDLDKATEIARAMVTRYGMSPQLGLAILESKQEATQDRRIGHGIVDASLPHVGDRTNDRDRDEQHRRQTFSAGCKEYLHIFPRNYLGCN